MHMPITPKGAHPRARPWGPAADVCQYVRAHALWCTCVCFYGLNVVPVYIYITYLFYSFYLFILFILFSSASNNISTAITTEKQAPASINSCGQGALCETLAAPRLQKKDTIRQHRIPPESFVVNLATSQTS